MILQEVAIEIVLDQSTLETIATGSLTGLVITAMNEKGHSYYLPEHVTLRFPQTSLEWRLKNGGPDNIVVPEYTIPCLLSSVLNLISKGVKLNIVGEHP